MHASVAAVAGRPRVGLGLWLLGAVGIALAGASLVSVYSGGFDPSLRSWMLAALAGLAWAFAFGGRWALLAAPVGAALLCALFETAVVPDAKLWQPPTQWKDLLTLTG